MRITSYKERKMSSSDGIRLPDDQVIKRLEEGEGYKYLDILEAYDIKNEEMKNSVSKEYFRRIKKILKSQLNGGNVVNAINSKAAATIRYGAGKRRK